MKRLGTTIAAITIAALAVAGCGGSNGKTNSAPVNPYSAAGAARTQPTGTSGSVATITTKDAGKLGVVLAGAGGRTAYLFEADKNGKSACAGACATAWPPVTTGGAPQASGKASATKLGTIKRADGTSQVVYAGHPLYYFARDRDSGDLYGQAVNAFGAEWYVLAPSGDKVE